MAQNDGVYVFDSAAKAASSIDPNLLLALQNNGGFGGNGGWFWIILLYMMWQRNGGQGNFNDFAAQYSGSEGRQYLAEIMNGRFDNLGNLANILNTSVETLKNLLFGIQSNIQAVATQVGMSGLEVQNAVNLGNAALAKQLCECCCNMRYDLAQQTNTIQAQAANNFAASQLQAAQNQAATQLQMAQIESVDQLAVCQQTNTLSTQADRNANAILGAINAQTVAMNDQFCALKERELQNKINMQGDIITQLRNQISNDQQTLQFNAAFHALDDKIDAIASKQPNTVPVQWPNIVAANATPYIGQGFNPWGYASGGTSYWG